MIRYFAIEQQMASGVTVSFIEKHTDLGCYSIPCDESNSDYQQYLAWVAEGNTAEEWTGE